MKKIVLLLIVSFSSISILAQDTYFKWAKQFAGTSVLTYGRGSGIEADSNGSVYSVGVFTGTVDFDPGPGVFNLTPISTDVYISKLDSAGNFLWAKQITGSFGTLTESFSVDKEFNIYITGTFQAAVDFDPGPGVFYLTANGAVDIFILKLTADGDFLWVKQIGAPTANIESYSSVLDSFGNIYFTGNYKGTLDFDPGPGTFTLTSAAGAFRDAFICKLDDAGNFVWAGSIGGSQSDYAFGISADKQDNIYVTGYFGATVDFDPGPAVFNLVSNGQEDMFILKLDATSNFVWARSIGGTSSDQMYKAVLNDAGYIYATGFFRGTADFDPGPAVFNLTSAGADAVFVLKLDAAGNFVWAKNMGGPANNNRGVDIALDRLGDVYTTGFFVGPADFDPGPGIFILNSGAMDMFISKLDNNGNFIWAKSAGAASQDQAHAITVDRFLNIYTTGYFGSTVDFDLEATTYYLTAIPVSDAFVLKVSQCPATTYETITDSACQSYTLNGQTYTASGIYRQVLYNAAGCDSIITLNLTIKSKSFSIINVDICSGQSYNGYTVAGTYIDTLIAANGCDSIRTLNLVIKPKSFSTISASICSGQSYEGHTAAGTYIDTFIAANGCDSIRTLNLSIKPGSFSIIDTTICQGQQYAGYRLPGTYVDVLTSANGCDSVRTINLTVKKDCGVYIPNSFTPNNDGLNDLFKPTINLAFQKFSFIIFNRYGEKIFETYEYGKGWNGMYKGKEQSAGSYVYRITFTNASGWQSENNGTVLLIR